MTVSPVVGASRRKGARPTARIHSRYAASTLRVASAQLAASDVSQPADAQSRISNLHCRVVWANCGGVIAMVLANCCESPRYQASRDVVEAVPALSSRYGLAVT